MTNEEAIYYIERMPKMFGIYGDFDNGKLNELKNVVEENTKLKAEKDFLLSEIENLKQESIYIELQSAYNTVRNMEDACRKLQEENAQLKADMEQSIKLPCKLILNQKAFFTGSGEPIEFTMVSFGWLFGDGFGTYGMGDFPNRTKIFFPFSYFGTSVFLTREEAEKSLEVQK